MPIVLPTDPSGNDLLRYVIAGYAVVGVALLIAWAFTRLGKERQDKWKTFGDFLICLFVVGVFGRGIIGAIIVSWDVPDIWHQPLGTLTLSEIAPNIAKLAVLFMAGSFCVDVIFHR